MIIMLSLVTMAYISLKNLNTDPIQREADLFSLYCITLSI